MNQRGMDKLLSDKFTLGADAAAAAGPVGRDAKADTDLMLHAEILSYARSRGAYAGLSLEGATLRPDNEENRKLYGRDISNKDILVQGAVTTPEVARTFTQALNRSSR
jgi:lipid-binding SYLF domain-containing protein